MRSLFLLAAAAVAVPASAANLIVNGGFEDTATPAGGFDQRTGGQSLGAWTVTGADVLNINTTYAETYGGSTLTFNAFAGSNALDITGAGNTSPANGIYQDVATTIGRTYRLSFYLGNASGLNDPRYTLPSSVSLNFGNQTFTNSAITQNGVNWALQSTTFVATGTTTRIAFTNATPAQAGYGGFGPDNYAGLDNVSLSVPEPAQWALMLGGFGLVGGVMRRRRGAIVTA